MIIHPSNMKGEGEKFPGATEGVNPFWLGERLRDAYYKGTIGFLFALPIVVACFSLTYAFAVVAVEIISYCLGGIVTEFDHWYNYEHIKGTIKMVERESPTTELGIVLRRLEQFENKYFTSIEWMYRYLDCEEVPFDNLDWLEIVSLLNQLSLYVGKRFDEEDKKGKEL